ncbi:hypothetical protein LRZ95_01270 [Candidatus Gracilibacteria bacterium]|nr:hypothetical protein [Candidatus Gracilibacteria bacterium]
MQIGFQLGREYKLSVAEILAVFPMGKTVFLSNDFLIIKGVEKENIIKKADKLGGTIKIVEIINYDDILKDGLDNEGKFKYGISIFGEKRNLKKILLEQKKIFKAKGVSSRFINKDFKNLSSAQILGEKLLKSGGDYSIIYTNDNQFVGKTIWVQDIDNYSKRDWQKDRDMQIGMLPPKLCQIMINLSGGKNIYDPFVGLGTVLIESILMGNKNVYGSDLNTKMVENTINNINDFIKTNNLNLDDLKIIKLNSKFINESEILLEKKVDSIVSEGYLGEVMTQKNINIERINKQKISLLELYNKFFEGLKDIKYKGNLVICFPFWEIKGKKIFFEEIYNILNKYCIIENLFPNNYIITTTSSGSLLYKRTKQLVGREIFKLKIK